MSAPSPTWHKIKLYAEEQIERNRTLLESAQSDTLYSLQSRIRVWREVLDLPSIINPDASGDQPSGY